ncbi:MAG TPA: type II toxin-antitoxin system PemK/MazF family toxin [Solirubrobacteraceae bacterium]
MSVPEAGQGEVWDCELDPVAGHEQAGRRPCLVISVDAIGKGPSGLAIVVPISRSTYNRLDVRIEPPERGLVAAAHALPYQVRTISRTRLAKRRGRVAEETLTEVIARVRLLIKFP